ncbi:MAG: hypothetical protein ACK4S6_00535 [Roseateles asaccharophilus]|uniref:hypothetical protein n=1 Tax=Roseateles asaccharophilus TaxID=582607 RepID=UPI003919C792
MSAASEAVGTKEQLDEREARITKLVGEVDSLAAVLPRGFAKSRLETVRILAKEVAVQSQALMLSRRLGRPNSEILETVDQLLSGLSRLRLLSSRTRVDQGTLLSVMLMEKLAAKLHVELIACEATDEGCQAGSGTTAVGPATQTS